MTNPNTDQSSASYPIGTVCSMTGVNPVTLRAWERRYGLIRPHRTAKGHRLYSMEDVERIREVLRLVEEGALISQVRGLLASNEAPPVDEAREGTWTSYRDRMIAAIAGFDENRLEQVYNEAMALYPVEVVTRQLLVPLLQELGRRWENATGSVAEEHFFGVYMRNKLGARFHHRQGNPQGPRLLVACLQGELHEIGALLFSLAAHDRGFQIVLLGADMPMEELPTVVRRAHCDAIVLSGSIEPKPELLSESLPRLVTEADVPVFLGGETASRHRESIVAAGARAIGNDLVLGLRDLDRELGAMRQ